MKPCSLSVRVDGIWGMVWICAKCIVSSSAYVINWDGSIGAHNGPRIHDLRHTFIVRRVMLWHAQGVDVDPQMLALSTYVGHAMVTNTYWYLTGVPELMALAAAKFEAFTQVSEVCHV